MDQDRANRGSGGSGSTGVIDIATLTPVQQEAISFLMEHSPPGDLFWTQLRDNLNTVFEGNAPRVCIQKQGQYLNVLVKDSGYQAGERTKH